MKRTLLALLAGALVAGVVASAAALIVGGGVVQGGTDYDLTCDDEVDVLGWGFESSDGLVYFARIGNISADCDGASMFVQVYDNGGSLIGGGSVATLDDATAPVGGYKVYLTPPVPPQNIGSVNVVLEGGE